MPVCQTGSEQDYERRSKAIQDFNISGLCFFKPPLQQYRIFCLIYFCRSCLLRWAALSDIMPYHLIDRLLDFFNQCSVVYYNTHGFLRHIFAGLHRNHEQGFAFSRVKALFQDIRQNTGLQPRSRIHSTNYDESYYSHIVPSRRRQTTRHLGATLFKSSLYQVCKSHVAASTHHDAWGLMQVAFQIITWSTDPVVLRRWAGLSIFF